MMTGVICTDELQPEFQGSLVVPLAADLGALDASPSIPAGSCRQEEYRHADGHTSRFAMCTTAPRVPFTSWAPA